MFGQDAQALWLQTSPETNSGTGREECDPRRELSSGKPAAASKGGTGPRTAGPGNQGICPRPHGHLSGGGKIQALTYEIPVPLLVPSVINSTYHDVRKRCASVSARLLSHALSSRTKTKAHSSAWFRDLARGLAPDLVDKYLFIKW